MILPMCVNISMPFLFADDSNLFSNGNDLTVLQYVTNEELQNITMVKMNKLSLNIKRTHFLYLQEGKFETVILP